MHNNMNANNKSKSMLPKNNVNDKRNERQKLKPRNIVRI